MLPAAPMFHAKLAIALGRAGRLDQAIVEWREAVRLSPTYSSARIGLANALLAKGDAGEAAGQCREVLRQEPDAVEAIVILGAALAAEGQVKEAISRFEQALKLEPQNAPAHFSLGLALHDRGQSRSTVAHLNEAIRLWSGSVPMLWQTAWILATSPDPVVRDGARSLELSRRAIQLCGGQEVRTFDALAAALAETEQFSSAVEASDHASTMALARNDTALADAIDQRTRLYRQGLPYRQPTTALPAEHARPE